MARVDQDVVRPDQEKPAAKAPVDPTVNSAAKSGRAGYTAAPKFYTCCSFDLSEFPLFFSFSSQHRQVVVVGG